MKKSFLQVDNILITIAILIAILALPINPFHDNLFTAPASDSGEVYDGDSLSYTQGGGMTPAGKTFILPPVPPDQCVPIFGSEIRITTADGISHSPKVAVDNSGNANIVWIDSLAAGTFEVYYKKINKQGNVLVNNMKIGRGSYAAVSAEIVVDKSDNSHIVWTDSPLDSPTIFYAKIDANGIIAVSEKVILPEQKFTNKAISIAVDLQGNIHLGWAFNSEIYYTKLDNIGNTLISAKQITSYTNRAMIPIVGGPEIYLDTSKGIIHVTHRVIDHAQVDAELYYVSLDINGNIVTKERYVGSLYYYTAEWDIPSMTADSSGNPIIILGTFGINYYKLDPTSITWKGFIAFYRQIVSRSPRWTSRTDIAMDNRDRLNIVWEGYTSSGNPSGQTNIFYDKFDSSGNSLAGKAQLSNVNSAQGFTPSIALAPDGTFNVVWVDYRHNGQTSPNTEIYYKSGKCT